LRQVGAIEGGCVGRGAELSDRGGAIAGLNHETWRNKGKDSSKFHSQM